MASVNAFSQEQDIAAIKEASGEATFEEATKKAQEVLDQLHNVTLDIAVTGESGAGKSTFINAIRGLNDDDQGAAETGVNETTTEPNSYKHPTMHNVTFWDLPGIGTEKHKTKQYVQELNFKSYDFFIIVSAGKFSENDILLATEIKKQKKLFYFVRSKIDIDVTQEGKKKSFNEDKTLAEIRTYCMKKLMKFENSKLFLISHNNISAFDFEALVKTLVSELPEHKRYALLLSVPVTSVAMLKEKVKWFEEAIWAAAVCSVAVAAVPVRGLSKACGAAIIVAFFTSCCYSFGLDEKSIQRLSKGVKKNLKSVITSEFVLKLGLKLLKEFDILEYLQKLEPNLNIVPASFEMMRKCLQRGLKELEDAALTVLREAGLE